MYVGQDHNLPARLKQATVAMLFSSTFLREEQSKHRATVARDVQKNKKSNCTRLKPFRCHELAGPISATCPKKAHKAMLQRHKVTGALVLTLNDIQAQLNRGGVGTKFSKMIMLHVPFVLTITDFFFFSCPIIKGQHCGFKIYKIISKCNNHYSYVTPVSLH